MVTRDTAQASSPLGAQDEDGNMVIFIFSIKHLPLWLEKSLTLLSCINHIRTCQLILKRSFSQSNRALLQADF